MLGVRMTKPSTLWETGRINPLGAQLVNSVVVDDVHIRHRIP